MSARLAASCAGCRHFNAQPADIEAALPGLAALSSAYAAVRSGDGLCAVHDRYVAANSLCAQHRAGDGAALKSLRPAPGNHKTSAPAPYR